MAAGLENLPAKGPAQAAWIDPQLVFPACPNGSQAVQSYSYGQDRAVRRLDVHGRPVLEIRPNQVIAGRVGELRLAKDTLVEIWTTAFERLLCPHGLRTLAPASPEYRGKFAGGPAERDSAYHQGTAWPWLFGPLFDLALKLFGTQAKQHGDNFDYRVLTQLTYLMLSHVLRLDANPCIGTIFEVASGDHPFEPGGAVSQAWSVSESIRILCQLERISQRDTAAGIRPLSTTRPNMEGK